MVRELLTSSRLCLSWLWLSATRLTQAYVESSQLPLSMDQTMSNSRSIRARNHLPQASQHGPIMWRVLLHAIKVTSYERVQTIQWVHLIATPLYFCVLCDCVTVNRWQWQTGLRFFWSVWNIWKNSINYWGCWERWCLHSTIYWMEVTTLSNYACSSSRSTFVSWCDTCWNVKYFGMMKHSVRNNTKHGMHTGLW